MKDTDVFFASLDELGEERVRERLAQGRTYGVEKHRLAQEWLRRRENSRSDADSFEQKRIARSAKNAAWTAAIAAIIAAIAAVASIFLSLS